MTTASLFLLFPNTLFHLKVARKAKNRLSTKLSQEKDEKVLKKKKRASVKRRPTLKTEDEFKEIEMAINIGEEGSFENLTIESMTEDFNLAVSKESALTSETVDGVVDKSNTSEDSSDSASIQERKHLPSMGGKLMTF